MIVLGVILLVGLIIFIIVQATKPKSIPAVVVKPSSEPIRQKAETLVSPKESGVYETLVPKPSASTSGSLGSDLHQRLAPYPVVKLQ